MLDQPRTVHEPDEELLSAEDAIEDAKRLDAWFEQRRQQRQTMPERLPLAALLESVDYLDMEGLRQLVRRAEVRLAEATNMSEK